MGRILRLSVTLLILTSVLAPVSEALDRWDAPGLGNDTEMGLFALVLVLCLVVVVSRLASGADTPQTLSVLETRSPALFRPSGTVPSLPLCRPAPECSPPLLI
jgi:hypothetical protein